MDDEDEDYFHKDVEKIDQIENCKIKSCSFNF